MREKIITFISDRRFEYSIIYIIILNSLILGLKTSPHIMSTCGLILIIFDNIILLFFVIELLLRLYVYRYRFFLDPWRVFDFLVIAIALVPASGSFSVFRAFRILRILRLLSVVPSLKKVVTGLVAALPGMGSIIVLMLLVFYVFSVMATQLFSTSFPQWFGSLGASSYSLFQIMTLESWSMGIVRPVMQKHPLAWFFFIPFIVSTTFTVLNLFIGIIVSAMQNEHERPSDCSQIHADQNIILTELKDLRTDMSELRRLIVKS
ncbi:ion transporter [Candidatus Endowatersipora endosymbiont of Watersipora subatra]|uniref:ion transporter n=1 Tax=Candidatus Endowatersipora endosymbiont of Watersipora subatra TaxID=3077946 RepID=UPI00312C8026